jgi:hypothetical protein
MPCSTNPVTGITLPTSNGVSEGMEMKKNLAWISVLALAALCSGKAVGEEANVTDRSISVSSFLDVGHMMKGSYWVLGKESKVENELLNRNGIALIYSGTVDEVLKMNIGVGGLFWKASPELTVQSKTIQFGPGISEASAEYLFSSNHKLKFGFFGYKYNPDASNLGEYLLRSEAYPTLIKTGGWVWMNSAAYQSMGLRYNWTALDGALSQDFLFFSEYAETPIFDFSPSYVATYKAGNILEIGAGFSLHRWLPIQPSVTTPNSEYNTYVEIPNFPAQPAITDSANYQTAKPAGTYKGMESNVSGAYVGTDLSAYLKAKDAAGNVIYVNGGTNDTLRPSVRKNLTFKGVKVMGRASLNLGEVVGLEEANHGPFKAFAEVAVLGIQNQPYFYDKLEERIPLMFGMHIPTFGLLDLLSFQVQYFKSPWPDDKRLQFDQSVPVPKLPTRLDAYYLQKAQGLYEEDDIKWTLVLKKNLFTGLDLQIQAANDHFRHMDPFTIPTDIPLTNRKDHWYYLMRLSWGM